MDFRESTRTSALEKESPLLLDDSWFSADSFLHHLYKDFLSLVSEESVVDGDLLTWARKLRELLENTVTHMGGNFSQKVQSMWLGF